ncbi:hypothetical protein [Halobacillus yeomjeoni]|uniref:Uncharacterized protein n=1 Tax=Halobacillus yeomjeoni TaxID=311194 RepID=A0A931HW68_9BACI|nr:hypothetical protein [Halobacillus yeomjeoni]MBH0230797.1 hypothetical protein [Halobacillus yeomjeoni]
MQQSIYDTMNIKNIVGLYTMILNQIHSGKLTSAMLYEVNLLEWAAYRKGFSLSYKKKKGSLLNSRVLISISTHPPSLSPQ